MRRTKKIMSFILSVMMLFTLAMPVMADEHSEHVITINETVAGHQFEAYQIFSGSVTELNSNYVISNPVWGSGVDSEATVSWKVDDVGTTQNLNLLDALKNSYINPTYYANYLEVTNAAGVVEALSKNNTATHADQFAKIVGKYLTNVCQTAKAYKVTGTDGEGNPIYVEAQAGDAIANYQIHEVSDGYYLIKENEDVNIPETTHTDYILQIVKDVEVTPKDGEVTVEKKIIEGGEPVDACANNIGDEVSFKITATLPLNYDEYDSYYQAFVDTMSAGLTLNADSVKVVTMNGDKSVEIDKTFYNIYDDAAEIAAYKTAKGLDAAENPTLVVEIEDLKALTASDNYTVQSSTKIILTYTATLNENAVIGAPSDAEKANPNEVYLKYDRSPYDEGYGETEEDVVYVFTFQLEVTKVDGQNTSALEDDTPLSGATFVLAREREGHMQYAVLKDNKIDHWTNWIDAADLKDYVEKKYSSSTEAEKEDKIDDLMAEYGVATPVTSQEDVNEVGGVKTYGPNHGKFNIIGLDLDTYWLIETAAPAGYNGVEPIKFTVYAKYDHTLGRVDGEGNPIANDTLTISIAADVQNGDSITGKVQTTVVNNPGSQLPSTGGIGTTIFYIAGGLMVAAAVVLLVTKKRMSNKN